MEKISNRLKLNRKCVTPAVKWVWFNKREKKSPLRKLNFTLMSEVVSRTSSYHVSNVVIACICPNRGTFSAKFMANCQNYEFSLFSVLLIFTTFCRRTIHGTSLPFFLRLQISRWILKGRFFFILKFQIRCGNRYIDMGI